MANWRRIGHSDGWSQGQESGNDSEAHAKPVFA